MIPSAAAWGSGTGRVTARTYATTANRTSLTGRPHSALALGDLLGQLRHDLEQVADHAEVRQLEDRRLRVLVDRDDRLRRLHPGPVLDRAGDAHRDVQLRGDRHAGLADLRLVRVPAGVGRRPGRAHRTTHRVGELLDHR